MDTAFSVLFVGGAPVLMLSGMRRSPWDDDTRIPEGNNMYRDDQSNELLGQILERSTSAPPLPSETSADFGGPTRGYSEGNADSVSVRWIPRDKA